MQMLHNNDEEALARLDQRRAMGTAAWRLLMPPVSVKRKVTLLIMDKFVDTSFSTILQAAADNSTSVIAIEARDYSAETAGGRVMALVRLGEQSILRMAGSLWSRERGQACILFGSPGNEDYMKLSHQGTLRLHDGPPKGATGDGVRHAANRLLQLMAVNDDTPTCELNYRLPSSF